MTSRRKARFGVLSFLRRHKRAEETAAEAVGLDLLWTFLRGAGLFGAGIASAAVVSTVTSTSTFHPSMPLSTKGAAFITRNEGLRLSPYNDPYNCTVGVGHLIHMGPCSPVDYAHWRISYAQAMTLLMHDSGWAASCVHQRITRRVTVPQDDALIDLAFNAGCGALDYSGIASLINRGDLAAVPGTLAHTAVTASGHYLPGLYTRRVAEGVLFERGYYGAGIGSYTPPRPLTAAQRKALAVKQAEAKLRARTGYWSWLAWRLGEGPWKPYRAAAATVRPHVSQHVPRAWWRRLRRFLAARR